MEDAVLASCEGSLTPGLERIVSALGYEIAATSVVDQPTDNEYHLPSGMVEALAEQIERIGAKFLVVDGTVHEGQLLDLITALPSVTIRDRRGVVWQRLANGENAAAASRLTLREHRVERRRARRDQRDGETAGPTGQSGAVEESERACERSAEKLTAHQKRQRRQTAEAYSDVDTYVTIVGRISSGSTAQAALTGESGASGPLRPATPRTTTTTIGPHELAVTETPGLFAGGPEWLWTAIPGTATAIERADLLLTVGEVAAAELGQRTNGTRLQVSSPSSGDVGSSYREELTAKVRSALSTAELAVELPYTDDGQALLSWLYERTTVQTVEYEEEIYALVECPSGATPEIERRIERAGGTSLGQ